MGGVEGHSKHQGTAARMKRLWGWNWRGRGRQQTCRNLPMVDGVVGQRRAPGQRAGGCVPALGGRGNGVRWAGSVPGLEIG